MSNLHGTLVITTAAACPIHDGLLVGLLLMGGMSFAEADDSSSHHKPRPKLEVMPHFDICIAGAGIIGLSLALELNRRGLKVAVLERGQPMREASTAAAGMLAADDPDNPVELHALSHLSLSLYPNFLDNLSHRGGIAVPFQTTQTLQSFFPPSSANNQAPLYPALIASLLSEGSSSHSLPAGFRFLDERSLDPRQLAPALLAAVAATSVSLLPESPVLSTRAASAIVAIGTPAQTIEAAHFIDCTGAWARNPAVHVVPIKGQMIAVALPASLPLKAAVRTRDLYIVPRITGPSAGRAIIGATIEDVGFDKAVHLSQIDDLRRRAAALLPPLANATALESWAGLRPATADRLPILGPHPGKPRQWLATGHYRNGILLAPATALVMAQLLLGEPPSVTLEAFAPARALPKKLLKKP